MGQLHVALAQGLRQEGKPLQQLAIVMCAACKRASKRSAEKGKPVASMQECTWRALPIRRLPTHMDTPGRDVLGRALEKLGQHLIPGLMHAPERQLVRQRRVCTQRRAWERVGRASNPLRGAHDELDCRLCSGGRAAVQGSHTSGPSAWTDQVHLKSPHLGWELPGPAL